MTIELLNKATFSRFFLVIEVLNFLIFSFLFGFGKIENDYFKSSKPLFKFIICRKPIENFGQKNIFFYSMNLAHSETYFIMLMLYSVPDLYKQQVHVYCLELGISFLNYRQ